jgi:SEC-C motif
VPLTPSEALVAELCRKSFLTLWSEPNPIVRPGKELCDLLVVCSPHVVIFSVKEIALKETGDPAKDWSRWHKKAIDESTKQIYGAERWIRSAERVSRADGSPGLLLPSKDELVVHRVAVALGGRGAVPYHQGDFGKGFVHVLDDTSLSVVLRELDTITDFVEYLAAKEALLARAKVDMAGQEEDLLAFYIHRGRLFPDGADMFVIGNDLWTGVTAKPEWKARKEADRESYLWDGIIETLHELDDPSLGREPLSSESETKDNLEAALRAMARENRFNRRILAQSFNEFMREAAASKIRARISPSLSNVRYVFLASARDEDREARRKELLLRCFVARGLADFTGDTVVGLATERYMPNAGFSMDAALLKKPEWTTDDQSALEGIQSDFGYFTNPRETRATGDEFPQSVGKVGRNDPCPCGSGHKYKKCHGAAK